MRSADYATNDDCDTDAAEQQRVLLVAALRKGQSHKGKKREKNWPKHHRQPDQHPSTMKYALRRTFSAGTPIAAIASISATTKVAGVSDSMQ